MTSDPSAGTPDMQSFVHQIAEPAIVCDGAGLVLAINEAAATLFQVRNEPVMGATFDRYIPCPREYHGNVVRYLRDFMRANPHQWADPIIAVCGPRTRLSLWANIVDLPFNGDSRSLLIFEDISLQVEEYARLQDNFSRAENLSRAKSQFLEHLNHQMRGPVAMLINLVAQVRDREDVPADIRHEMEMAFLSGREMQKAMAEIDNFTRIENDKIEFESVCFNVRHVLEDVMDGYSDLARRHNLEVATLIAPNVPEFLIGDPERLRQILQSLLNNAFGHTIEGSVTLRASCPADTERHATIEFEVSDTGCGMPDTRRRDMQASFDNHRQDFANRFVGLGIGLAIAKELVDRMEGRLAVRSTVHVGSTFLATLRFERGERLHQQHRLLAGKRVLIVNDTLDDRGWLAATCERERMIVDWAGTGDHALRMLMKENTTLTPVDFVLIDLHDLKLAGIHLAQEIRCQTRLNDVSIVMLVNEDECVTPMVAGNSGVNVLLDKPLRETLIPEAFRAALAQQRQWQPILLTRHLLQLQGERRMVRALLVEDNEVNQIIAKGAMKRLGIAADVTHNGEEAIDALHERHYDFVLMDCEMPIMDGFTATRLIREWEVSHGGHVPIIALTASDAANCQAECVAAGMDDYMQKPFRSDQLQTILSRWVPAFRKG